MLKAGLRREMLHKRDKYSAPEIQELSCRIAGQFFDFFSLSPGQTIHIFLPITRKKEVDTWQIIRQVQLNDPGIRIAVSVANTQDLTLGHFLLEPGVMLLENKWGIPEPVEARTVPVHEIDLVLVPLLAFDRQGHRVGYGKGFYDRFLQQCRPDTLKIGLSFEGSVHQIADVHPGDVVLDYAVTPDKVICFADQPAQVV